MTTSTTTKKDKIAWKKINHAHGQHQIVCKNAKEFEILIQVERISSQDIGMEFGIEKCVMLIMKSEKHEMTKGIELPNQDKIRTLGEKGNLQILGKIGSGHHQTCGDERKKKKKRIPQENEKTSRNQTT